MASAAVKKLQRRIARYAAQVEPEIARRLLRAYEVIRTSLTESEIVTLLRSGASAERVALNIANLPDLDNFLVSELGPTLDQSALGAGSRFSIDLPNAAARAGVSGGVSLLNPRVIEALAGIQGRNHDGSVQAHGAVRRPSPLGQIDGRTRCIDPAVTSVPFGSCSIEHRIRRKRWCLAGSSSREARRSAPALGQCRQLAVG